jgi:uncharacterized protein YkwD
MRITFLLLLVTSLAPALAHAQSGYDPTAQSQLLLYDEAQTVYLGNLARRQNGVSPLRWNLQMTHAARGFSWDSTENRAPGFCGHQDTQGGWPGNRLSTFGYRGSGGAENAFCGYVTPEYAIQGWMNSAMRSSAPVRSAKRSTWAPIFPWMSWGHLISARSSRT